MGWASGSSLAENLWDLVREHIPEKKRTKVAQAFIDEFESMDCDTIMECETLCLDAYGECDCGNVLSSKDAELCWSCEDERLENDE